MACTGAGIIAPLPRGGHDDPFVSMNGRSMASPIACAALAILLARDEGYIDVEPNWQRAR